MDDDVETDIILICKKELEPRFRPYLEYVEKNADEFVLGRYPDMGDIDVEEERAVKEKKEKKDKKKNKKDKKKDKNKKNKKKKGEDDPEPFLKFAENFRPVPDVWRSTFHPANPGGPGAGNGGAAGAAGAGGGLLRYRPALPGRAF